MKKESKKYQKTISGGVVLGKKALSVAGRMLIELLEQIDDIKFTETHYRSIFSSDLRAERYESEEGKRLHEEKMRRQAIKRLANQKFIKQCKEGERVVLELTEDGKIQALKMLIANCHDHFDGGRICLVYFDIPEAAKSARAAFRRFIKTVGFKYVQGSVWSIEKDVFKEMRYLIGLLKIDRWVEVYIAEK